MVDNAEWKLTRLKTIGRILSGGTPDSSNPDYWDGDITWVTPSDLGKIQGYQLVSSERKITEAGYQNCGTSLCPPGSIIVSVRAPIGYLAVSEIECCTNQGCKTIVSKNCDPRFVYYSLSTQRAELASLGSGSTFMELSADSLGTVCIPLPELITQKRIADFLDQETAKIDSLIEDKERLLKVLDERCQTLITEAVTRGLESNGATKPTGIPWLGSIPTHWQLLSLGKIAVDRCDGPFGSGLKSEHYVDTGIRVIRLQNIKNGLFDGTDEAFITPEHYQTLGDHGVEPGDILIAGLGDENNPVGRACVAPDDLGPAMVKADCFRYRLDRKLADPSFIAWHLSCTATTMGGAFSTGTTRARMNLSSTSQKPVVLPPLEEQRRISEFIDSSRREIQEVYVLIQRAVDQLKERRAALIHEAVTGQI